MSFTGNMKQFEPILTANINRKGVMDIDTVKGCSLGMLKHPQHGCYNACYAYKMASLYGYDFAKSINRQITTDAIIPVESAVKKHNSRFFRIGTMGDPSHNWSLTLEVCEWLGKIRIPVIITKHWIQLSDKELNRLLKCNAVINTSISPLDDKDEISYRLGEFKRLKKYGIRSVLRIVSARFGNTQNGQLYNSIQAELFKHYPIIDNPLRLLSTDKRIIDGDILVEKKEILNNNNVISMINKDTYIGTCKNCPEQCGVSLYKNLRRVNMAAEQMELFTDKVEYLYVESVIGSGYEKQVAELAVIDGVAYRAARKNMQIHSAIILKINDEFSGFFTFQVNHEAKEFCLLQSAMSLNKKNKAIYSEMVKKIIEQNTFGYPMVMTVSTKHDLERPDVFEAVGFKTYLELSGFAYMVYGTLDQVRFKRLAHATMTNTWNSTKADWLKMKKEWNEKIEDAGTKHGIDNPKFATRDGCWQGANGMSNVVLAKHEIEDGEVQHKKGKSFNGNASVLDPVACDAILRFFMPTNGKRVYNPFGGGVQFGFITGSYGYEYVSSEIRQNQCDANNKLCGDFNNVQWIKSDSSTYEPCGKFDLIFTCPPYYKVEKYVDYDGNPPEGEINTLDTYEKFRDTLFKGYRIAIEHLNDNCFFVVMTGDSRDKNGAYYCSEAETELFFKDAGLSVYNKIIYLECEFTRLAHAKTTLNYRKFPKREQKIIVAYKGNISAIRESYPPIGRL
jgi:hypothetical protein